MNINTETVANWLGLHDFYEKNSNPFGPNDLTLSRLIFEGFEEKIQGGLSLSDIEYFVFFLLFARFLVLAFRYNLKTSFVITCFGISAGLVWYFHLIQVISFYRVPLSNISFLKPLSREIYDMRDTTTTLFLYNKGLEKIGDTAHWYNPIKVIYFAFYRGMVQINEKNGVLYYIDPISMIISSLDEPLKSNVTPYYYKIYDYFIPASLSILKRIYRNIQSVAAYSLITRAGKKYCPYLLRWHWTFVMLLMIIEQQIYIVFNRTIQYQVQVVEPLLDPEIFTTNYVYEEALFKMHLINACLISVAAMHIFLILFFLFHAVLGQYFYFPLLTENTELHIGPRPKNSLYSGGYTAWQDPEEKKKKKNRIIPKLWYGWFGRGTGKNWFVELLKKLFKKFLKLFKNSRKKK